jgi:Mg-chelatase subunit ChlD
MLMGSAGLAIDAAVLYLIKARLTAACDAASLAAARNLHLGQNWTDQAAQARLRAESFFYSNFPYQFLGGTRGRPTITIPDNVPQDRVLTISTEATAVTQTYFMRYLGAGNVTVGAGGTASRRAVNLVMVLDRSGSMETSDSCEPMKTAAANFVRKFVDGRDRLGVITFGTDYVEALQPTFYFKSGGTRAVDVIDDISCSGKTSVTAAYWRAYQQLVALDQQNALNVVVLFTDGAPNGFYGTFNRRSGSDCSQATMTGVVAEGPRGLFKLLGNNPAIGDEAFVNNPGCAYLHDQDDVGEDIYVFPSTDAWGNKPRGYASDVGLSSDYLGYTSSQLDNGKVKIASDNANEKASKSILDHAAARIRLRRDPVNTTSTTNFQHPIGVVTYVIGLAVGASSSADQPDPVLMSRVANQRTLHGTSTANPAYRQGDRSPDGLYVQSNANGDLGSAFDRIAAEVLRISR